MKPFNRIVPKKGGEELVAKLCKLGEADKIIALALTDQIEELSGVKVTYSDYHGMGVLDTPYFIAMTATFPVRVKEERLTKVNT